MNAVSNPITNTPGRKPTKNPAVGDDSAVNPLRPPERIGSPAIARTMKMTTASVPFLGPRMAPVSITPRVWNVMGTPALPTLICPGKPSAAISAANTAAWVMSEIDRDSHRRPGLSADDLAFSRSSEVLISTWSIPRRHLRSEGTACAAVTGTACAVMASVRTHRMGW